MRRQILSRSLLTVAAASSILAVTGGIASADPDTGARSTSGHSADDQAASQDDSAASAASGARSSATESRSYGSSASGASAEGEAEGSPGVLSGNNLSVPIHVPVNVCGNSVDVVGVLNPAFGNKCANVAAPAAEARQQQDTPPAPPAAPPKADTPEVHTQLAETGASGGTVGVAAGAGAAMLLGGAMLYRRSRRASQVRRTYS